MKLELQAKYYLSLKCYSKIHQNGREMQSKYLNCYIEYKNRIYNVESLKCIQRNRIIYRNQNITPCSGGGLGYSIYGILVMGDYGIKQNLQQMLI